MKHCITLGMRFVLLLLGLAPLVAMAQLPPLPTSPAPVVKREYFAGGNPKAVILAPDQTNFSLTTRYGYDNLKRNTSITDALAGVVDLVYEGRDVPISVKDPRRLTTTYGRDGFDQVRSLTSPDTGTASSSFDAAGNLLTRLDSRGVLATYAYDALNRPTSVTFSKAGSASLVQTWGYDGTLPENTHGRGRLTSTTYPGGSTSYGYDPEGRLVSFVQRHAGLRELSNVVQIVGYEYDAGGRLSRLTYPSGRVLSIAYSDGLPRSLTLLPAAAAAGGQALLTDIHYEPFGAVRSWQWQLSGSPQLHQREFDTYGRLVRYRLGSVVRDLSYDEADRITRYAHYDDSTNGNPVRALDQTFIYDALGRLTDATVNQVAWTFRYDANGNRLSHAAGGAARSYTVSETSNRLLGLDNPARALAYDAMGNVTTDPETLGAAVYDLSGRLSTVTRAGVTTTYILNAKGLRVRKDSNTRSGERLIFAYDSAGHLLGEYDYTGAAVREYVWLGDTPVAVFTPGPQAADPPRVYAIHADHLDTPRVVADSTNGTRWRWLSDPFGVYVADENPAGLGAFTMPLRFPGQYFDRETGMHYNVMRDYDGTTGRYAQSDPIGLAGGINTYGYVGGNPLSYADPMGLRDTSGVYGVAAAVGVGAVVITAPAWAVPVAIGTAAVAVAGGIYLALQPANYNDLDHSSPVGPLPLDKALEKELDHELYKWRCDKDRPPPGLDRCETAKWERERARQCRDQRKRWDDKWWPSRHAQAVKEANTRYEKWDAIVKRECTCP
jgi:RHS repeat-associated protein